VQPEDASLERLRATRRRSEPNEFRRAVNATGGARGLGRRHGTMAHEEVSRNVTEAGFVTWNMDLIIVLAPNHSMTFATRWTIYSARISPPHISCYVLTPELGTPLGDDPTRHPTRTSRPTRTKW